MCAVSCDEGYEADPPNFLCGKYTCLLVCFRAEPVSWVYVCVHFVHFSERRCPMLDAPHNGEVSQPSRTVDSVATYSCNIGFTIVEGDEMRTCNANSTWDREALLCSGNHRLPILYGNEAFLVYTSYSCLYLTMLSSSAYS